MRVSATSVLITHSRFRMCSIFEYSFQHQSSHHRSPARKICTKLATIDCAGVILPQHDCSLSKLRPGPCLRFPGYYQSLHPIQSVRMFKSVHLERRRIIGASFFERDRLRFRASGRVGDCGVVEQLLSERNTEFMSKHFRFYNRFPYL